MTKRLKPLNDFVFKKLFGEQSDKDLLIGFLNSILSVKIEDIEIKEEKLEREKLEDKQGILDIKAVTDKGEKINIEVQLINQYNMIERTLFYWSKLYTEGFQAKQNFKELKKTITINILGFSMLETVHFHSSYHLYEDETKHLLTDLLEIHFIELPKFKKIEFDLHNPLHRWLLFLQEDVSEPILEEITMMDNLIKKAEEKLTYLSLNDEMRRMYELREKFLRDSITQIEGAKEEGRKEGRKEGEKEKAKEIAKNLLQEGFSIEKVRKLTGLDEEEIKALE
jgi:predicted transposase/invertase (TIGR01784 family)